MNSTIHPDARNHPATSGLQDGWTLFKNRKSIARLMIIAEKTVNMTMRKAKIHLSDYNIFRGKNPQNEFSREKIEDAKFRHCARQTVTQSTAGDTAKMSHSSIFSRTMHFLNIQNAVLGENSSYYTIPAFAKCFFKIALPNRPPRIPKAKHKTI